MRIVIVLLLIGYIQHCSGVKEKRKRYPLVTHKSKPYSTRRRVASKMYKDTLPFEVDVNHECTLEARLLRENSEPRIHRFDEVFLEKNIGEIWEHATMLDSDLQTLRYGNDVVSHIVIVYIPY